MRAAPIPSVRGGSVVGSAHPHPDFVRLPGDPGVLALVVGWVTAVLLLDAGVGAGGQAALGALTWVLLLGVLRREVLLVRVQVAVVVGFATLIEYSFSAWLGVYEYRLGGLAGVPTFVPPGHGLVYLAALLIGRSGFVAAHRRACVALTVVAGGGYAAWGVLVSGRTDALGAFWFGCLLLFLALGRARRGLYVGAFVVVTYLEVLGTALGVWTWRTEDFTGIVAIGNPPSGAAGGYGWFDLAAVLLAPVLITAWRRRATRRRLRRPPAALLRYPSSHAATLARAGSRGRAGRAGSGADAGEDLVVEQAVGRDGAAAGHGRAAGH